VAPEQVEDGQADEVALIADLREAFGFRNGSSAHAAADLADSAREGSDPFGLRCGPASFPAGTRLGDFEIDGEIGRGGMGVVYRARQVSLGRHVALKVLPGYARHGRLAVERFRAEAQAAARLHHTNVVPVYAQGEANGHYFYAMELIDGVSLDTVIRSRPDLLSTAALHGSSSALRFKTEHDAAPVPPGSSESAVHTTGAAVPDHDAAAARAAWTRADYRHVAHLVAEVADALACAHRHGVIHRDVKPHNLLLAANNHLHLTDFGLARLTDEPHLTVSGEIMGTAAYLSPEHIQGPADAVDHRTDIYSLGVTLYEMVTGRKPFDGESREQIIDQIVRAEPLAPRRIDRRIPVDLETICLRAIEKDPSRRHPTAAMLAEDLRRFAVGRPILSRRTSTFEKTAKWVRRHKTLTAAGLAVAAVLVLSVVLVLSTRAGRHREANELLDRAYTQLAFTDYHTPHRVADDLARAATLGADPYELRLTQTLSCLGTGDTAGAIKLLKEVLADDPPDLRPWYLLAWAQWRGSDYDAARETLAQAEQRGPPKRAESWFFRGLAIHYEDPQAAIESYREANAWKARVRGFYPQAVLHLARAQNQQVYATRSLEAFPEADASLRQLIAHGYYGAYPYYLLSITHRLAAEIYAGSGGTRDDTPVREHYNESLHWARAGQTLEPLNDRPVVAEAECLESMGDYAGAIDARSRALELALRDVARCEEYHYRWRLYFWTGDLDAALADAQAHAACVPGNIQYAHVYPALIHAERGEFDEALTHARAIADEAPNDANAVLWSAACLRLLGQGDEAAALLADRAATIDYTASFSPPQSEQWLRTLYAYCQTGGSLDELYDLADRERAPWKLWGEAEFHAAVLLLSEGDREDAMVHLRRAYRSFDSEMRYTYHAKLLLRKMQQDPAWPGWLRLSWVHTREAVPGDDLPNVIGPVSQGEGGGP
jgi:serine/threonine protein kinase/predicted Zn-dependent protease